MLGFVKRELKMLLKDVRVYLLMIVIFYIAMGLDLQKMTFILPFYTVIILSTSFAYDENSNFYGFSASFPGGRKNVVNGKYVSVIVLLIISTVMSFILFFIQKNFNENISFESQLGQVAVSSLGALIPISFIIPLMYKFGTQKARFGLFILFFGGSFGLSFLELPNIGGSKLILFSSLIVILIFLLSYFISLSIMKKKDF